MHSSPGSLFFAFLHYGVCWSGTLPWVDLLESPGTDKLLSLEWCPREKLSGSWGLLWRQTGSAWPGWTDSVSAGDGAGGAGWGGQFCAQKEAPTEGVWITRTSKSWACACPWVTRGLRGALRFSACGSGRNDRTSRLDQKVLWTIVKCHNLASEPISSHIITLFSDQGTEWDVLS